MIKALELLLKEDLYKAPEGARELIETSMLERYIPSSSQLINVLRHSNLMFEVDLNDKYTRILYKSGQPYRIYTSNDLYDLGDGTEIYEERQKDRFGI